MENHYNHGYEKLTSLLNQNYPIRADEDPNVSLFTQHQVKWIIQYHNSKNKEIAPDENRKREKKKDGNTKNKKKQKGGTGSKKPLINFTYNNNSTDTSNTSNNSTNSSNSNNSNNSNTEDMLALDKKMFLLSLTDNIDNMSREEYNHKKLIISNNINKKFTPTPKKTILYDPIESQKYKKDYNKLARNYRR